MKTIHLLGLLLALFLLLGAAPIAHTIESLNISGSVDATESLSLDSVTNEPTEPEGEPFSAFNASSALSVVQSPAGGWEIECVDCPKQFEFMTDRSLQLDSEGHPHIAAGGNHLYYARHDGTEWRIETVDVQGDAGRHASLALDGLNHPHISYCAYYGGKYRFECRELRYAWYDGSAWHIEPVDSGWNVGGHSSLAVDGLGQAHITYSDDTADNLKYARYDGAVWHIETVDDEEDVDGSTSLALDESGWPHVSYFGSSDLKYAWYDGAVWHIETVYSGKCSSRISLALDGSDRPHIICGEAGESWDIINIKYAWRDGVGWHIETVGETGWNTSLALDGKDRPHISYYDYPDGGLKYAWRDWPRWRVGTVDSEWSGQTSLALDGAGHPHISYCTSYHGEKNECDLKHAWYDGRTWRNEIVDSGGYAGRHNSLALDSGGLPHISYLEWGDKDLKYARYDGVDWYIERVDDAEGLFTSLALDKSDQPHISYHRGGLKHAWHNGLGWQIEMVDSGGNVGLCTSLALDGSGRPHISYYDYTRGDLKYARHDGADWQIETVDSAGDVGLYTSLALDGSGRPHISYYKYTKSDLKYARHDGTGWQIETVDSEGVVGKYTSLALDELGRPHISYYDDSIDDLKYARHDGADWHIETVDVGNMMLMIETSLVLDKSGRPHISYCRGHYGSDYWTKIPYLVCDELRYAWYNGTNWQSNVVDDTDFVGFYPSLALDEIGRPHISYHDGTSGSLKYAVRHLSLNKQALPGDSLRSNDTVTYTLTFYSPGLHVHLWDPLPTNVSYVTASVTSTLTPAAVYSPTIRAVVWQGRVPTDTASVIQFQATPCITGTGALSTPLAIANTVWLTDTENGWIISTTASFTVMPAPLFLDKQATPKDGLRNNDILTYTLTLSGSDQTARLWDPLPLHVRYITDSITSTLTPPAVYSPTARAIIWQGTLAADTVPIVRFRAAPHITGTGTLLTPIHITSTAWLTVTAGVESGRSISATAGITVTPGPLFLEKQATPKDGLRNNDTLTYTLTFSGSGQTTRLWDPLPASVSYISDSITSALTPLASYSPSIKAIVWEGILSANTVQEIRFQVTPGISGTEPLSLSQPIVNTAWLTVTAGVESGGSVSATVIVNGYYRYLPVVMRND